MIRPSEPMEEARFFPNDSQYDWYKLMVTRPISSVKCWDLKFLQSKRLRNFYELLKHYKLVKFVSFSLSYLPRLVRMLYANLRVMFRKLFAFVMNT